MTDLVTPISDERLAEIVGAGVPCVPIEPWEVAHVVQELRSLRAQGGVRVSPALLQGVCDSLRAAIYEYEDRDVFPGARTIMQAQLDAILSSLEASPVTKYEASYNGEGYSFTGRSRPVEESPAPVSEEMVLVPRAELARLVSQYEVEFDPETIIRPAWVEEALNAPAALAAKGGQ